MQDTLHGKISPVFGREADALVRRIGLDRAVRAEDEAAAAGLCAEAADLRLELVVRALYSMPAGVLSSPPSTHFTFGKKSRPSRMPIFSTYTAQFTAAAS